MRKVFLVAVLVATLGGGFASGWAYSAPAAPSESDIVTNYNDGWTDSKLDDCESGASQYACQWVAKGSPECTQEDGSAQDVCVWHARKHGNGKGRDVLNMSHGDEHVTLQHGTDQVTVDLAQLPVRGKCWWEVGYVDSDGKPGGSLFLKKEPICKF